MQEAMNRRGWRGRATRLLPLLLAALVLAGWGCAPGARPGPPEGLGSNMVPGVPYFPQPDYQCGPATLAMVLEYVGDPVPVDEIATGVFRSDLHGTVSLDMALYARSRGHKTTFGPGTAMDLVSNVDKGLPVIVMVNEGFSLVRAMHYMVVVGYTPEAVIVHSGPDRARHLPWPGFLARWRDADNWVLRIEPRTTE